MTKTAAPEINATQEAIKHTMTHALTNGGIDEWNELRYEYSHIKLEFCNHDFSGLDLPFRNLSGLNFFGSKFSGTDLDGADLTGCTGLTAHQLAQARNLEHALLDPNRYADAVAAGYKRANEK